MKARLYQPLPQPPFYQTIELEIPTTTSLQQKLQTIQQQLPQTVALLEISTAANQLQQPIPGFLYSAFNLKTQLTPTHTIPLEAAYQYSKRWYNKTTPYPALSTLPPNITGQQAKAYARSYQHLPISHFELKLTPDTPPIQFPNQPPDAFYNFLYLLSLFQDHNRKTLLSPIVQYFRNPNLPPPVFHDTYHSPHQIASQAKTLALLGGITQFYGRETPTIIPYHTSLIDILDTLQNQFQHFVEKIYRVP